MALAQSHYSTFDAPKETIDVFRLSFVPEKITADGRQLSTRRNLAGNGFTVKKLTNGDAIVEIRHDGSRRIAIAGKDPQTVLAAAALSYEGNWARDNEDYCASEKDASVTSRFRGNQIRLVGRADPSGGRAEVFIDGVKQIVPVDCWNPVARAGQILYYKNGLEGGEHTLKIVALGAHNPYSRGDRIYVDGAQFSAESKAYNFPTGTGPTGAQRMIFGYTSREDYRDSKGGLWRPATEVAARFGPAIDTLAAGWWTNAAEKITGTRELELYRYGLHGHEFRVNLTVGPGKYDLRLAFANTRGLDTQKNCFDILINGRTVAQKLDVTATAGGPNKTVDLIFKNIAPSNGVIEVFFKGYEFPKGAATRHGEAFVQALEIGKNLRGEGAMPISSLWKPR